MSLKQYTILTLKHLVSSQFLASRPDNVANVKRMWFTIQTKKIKQINYLYLWFFTYQLPASPRFRLVKTNASQIWMVKRKIRKQYLQVLIKKRKQYFFLQQLLKLIIAKQFSSEKRTWTLYQNCINVKIATAILTHQTAGLQTKNNYFPLIPLELRFRFSQATIFEKLFLLRAFQILSSRQKLKGLDIINA